jgi:predicted membrane chloride channel (bestrophin family)
MPAPNPLFHGSWTLKKFRATVVNDIWPEVLFFSLIATMVTLVSELTRHKLQVSNQMLTVLGTVLGLVISFRTSSAYERYQDGRKMWSNIMLASRNIAMAVWIHVPFKRVDSETKETKPILESVIEKKSIINLIQAFSVSIKHFLRAEPGIYYEDLYPLICFLPRYAVEPPVVPTSEDLLPLWSALENEVSDSKVADTEKPNKSSATLSLPQGDDGASRSRNASPRRQKTFDPEKVLPVVDSERPLQPACNPPATSYWEYAGPLRAMRPLIRLVRGRKAQDLTLSGRKRQAMDVESNVPLEITLFLNSYLAWLLGNGMIQPAIATSLVNNIATLQDTMSNLERIRNTPLPFAYQAHLRISLWLYLFLLPFQIHSAFSWITIPATAFASFLLLGFLEIGQEIENPFNYDENDLDLDHFCLMLQRELHEITTHTSSDPSAFIFSPFNQPFAPGDRRTAEEMQQDVEHEYHKEGPGVGLDSVRRTMLKSWRDVDRTTRRHKKQY